MYDSFKLITLSVFRMCVYYNKPNSLNNSVGLDFRLTISGVPPRENMAHTFNLFDISS